MLRYICDNPDCLRTFLSHQIDRFRKCEFCGTLLVHFGKPEKNGDKNSVNPYPTTGETHDDLKIKYVKLRQRALKFGLTQEECQIVGRAIRKLSLKERKQALEENGLWEEGIIYKHVKTKEGLMKIEVDKRAMANRDKKNKMK